MEEMDASTPGNEAEYSDSGSDDAGDETAMEIAESMKPHERRAAGDADEANGGHDEDVEDYSVFSNPQNLGSIRQRMFDVEDPIEITQNEFEAYFPFVDNVWSKNRTSQANPNSDVATDWYWCRLRKAPSWRPSEPRPTPEGKKPRKKRAREERTCPMSMKVVRRDGVIPTYTILRGVAKEIKHSHDLDYMDSTKRNRGIMNTARQEAQKGYLPSSVYAKMWEEPEKMHDAGGKFMKVSDVRNVQYHWRLEHPNVILRAHQGYQYKNGASIVPNAPGKRGPGRPTGPRQPNSKSSQTPGSSGPSQAMQPPLLPTPTFNLPANTLRYPPHARDFLESYLPSAESTQDSPHVTLTYASSLDARISLAPGLQTALSGPESKAMTHYLRSRHDAIMIGVRTALADDPALNCRLEGAGGYGGFGWSWQPRPIIIDPHARLQIRPELRLLQTAAEGKGKAPWIVVSSSAHISPPSVSYLKGLGGEYLMVHSPSFQFDWTSVFRILASEGIKSVMVEGGGAILSQLLKADEANLVNSVIITVTPTFLGNAGVNVSPTPRIEENKPVQMRLKEIKWQPMGAEDVILCGKMKHEPSAPALIEGIEAFAQDGDQSSSQQQSQQPTQEGKTSPHQQPAPPPPAVNGYTPATQTPDGPLRA
ncbi:MAG: hypothetical protein Q9227_009323 [Pyrenula ochraceoflavens]